MPFYKTLLFARFLGLLGVVLFGIGGYYGYWYGLAYFQLRNLLVGIDGSPNLLAMYGLLQCESLFFGSVAIISVGVLLMIASAVLGYIRTLWIRIATPA